MGVCMLVCLWTSRHRGTKECSQFSHLSSSIKKNFKFICCFFCQIYSFMLIVYGTVGQYYRKVTDTDIYTFSFQFS